MRKYVTSVFILPVLLFLTGSLSFGQEQIPAMRDQLREQYTDRDLEIFLQKEKNGEIPKQDGEVFSKFATDVLVNNNTGSTATGYFTQSETSLLAFGSTVIIGFNDAGSNSGGANRFTGYSRSTNGGVSFTDAGTLPANAGGDAGDPVLARNETTGRLYFSTLGFSTSTIQVFRSDDNGVTWLPPVNGTPGGDNEDKQWITVDNFPGAGNGNVYIMSRRFGGSQGIYVFRSTDHGANFTPNLGVLIINANQGAFIAVGPDHSVYAFWYAGTTLKMRKSIDQGVSFAPEVTVVSGLVGGVNGDHGLVGIRNGVATPLAFRSSSFPHVAVNPVNGYLYVTYADKSAASGDKVDVFLVTSTNGGASWSSRQRVNDDATTTDQWMPTIAVTPDGLNIGIFYYSRQEDPANNLLKYYGRLGVISGSTITFSPSFAVSDVASYPEFGRDNAVNSVYMGDYNHVVATPQKFHVVWADNRDDFTLGPPRKDPNVYYETILIGPPCPITAASNPSPAAGATGLPISGTSLSWTNGAGASQIEIWFGQTGSVSQVYNGALVSSYALGTLQFNTNYSWQIILKNDTCQVYSPLWTFTTMPDPNIVINNIFCETFESGLGGWTIVNNGGTTGCVWQIRSAPFPNAYTLPPTAAGGVMTADVDECGTGSTLNSTATLNTAYNLSIYTSVWIEFDNDWETLTALDEAHVEVSTDGGTSWTGVWDKIGTDVRNTHEIVTISSLAAGKTNVKFRLRSVQPAWDWWWAVDNFCVYGSYTISTNFQLTVNILNGWNMVSIPGLHPTNQNTSTWWSGRDPGTGVFKFQAGYQTVTTVAPGTGYWMKHIGANTYNTGGEWPAGGIQIVPHTPITGAAGWNLFGGYEQSVATAGITTTPPGLISGSIYKYSGGYSTAATLEPGYGYWVKLNAAGQINIPPTLGNSSKIPAVSTEGFDRIVITDNSSQSYTLYAANDEADLSQFDLPPYPPQGMFDVRFASQRYAERLSSSPQLIEMMGVSYPVKVKSEGKGIILSDEFGNEIARLKPGEEVTLNSVVNKLMVTENIIPVIYSLEQNYPNPFNPGTTIQFSIPENVQNVKVTIYNSLGEKIADLVNSSLNAGTYRYNWNADNYASGIYLYQIATEKFVSTKKMILLK